MSCILNAIDDMIKDREDKGLCPNCGEVKLTEENRKYFGGYVCENCYSNLLKNYRSWN